MDLVFMERFLVGYFLAVGLDHMGLGSDNFRVIFFSFPGRFQYHLLGGLRCLKWSYLVTFVSLSYLV